MKPLSLSSSHLYVVLTIVVMVVLIIAFIMEGNISEYFFLQFRAPGIIEKYGVRVDMMTVPNPSNNKWPKLVVTWLDSNKPLAKAGLQQGDIIYQSYNHNPVVIFYARLDADGPCNNRVIRAIDPIEYATKGNDGIMREICPP